MASSSDTAPALSNGSFPLPHLGDCTHEGHPSEQGQPATVSSVASSHRRAEVKPRSAMPAPPSYPSYTKIVQDPVSGWYAVETPPTSQRSHVATSGNNPIAACSAAWAAPGTSDGRIDARSITACEIPHHAARVSSSTGGSSSGTTSRTSPVATCLRAYATT